GLEAAREHRGRVLVDAELVVVFVRRDLFPLVRLFLRAERALADVLELASVRRGRRRLQPRLAADAGRDGGRRAGGRANEVAPIQIQLLVGDLRAADVRRALDEHGPALSMPERRRRLRRRITII